MFNSKKCSNCKSKIKNSFSYCPYCGKPVEISKEDWGMLGKNDFDKKVEDPFEPMLGKLINGTLNSVFSNMMNNIEKELSVPKNTPNKRLRLVINGKEIPLDNSKRLEEKPKPKKTKTNILLPTNSLNGFNKLPQKEPKTNIRRIENSLIYEIELPGITSEKDISIRHLGNCIEVRAITEKNSYFKSIAIALPIVAYNVQNEILTLELGEKAE